MVFTAEDFIIIYDHSSMHIKFELMEAVEMSQHCRFMSVLL